MESAWFKQKKDLERIPDIDILIIGINTPWPRGCINNDFHNSYYKEFIPWIVKISNEFPNKKIFYKHHNYFKGDTRETELLDNSNLKVIVNDKSLNSTYGWAFKSKIIISFASTMIVELIGNGKQAYFIDPGGINHQWFYGINNLEKEYAGLEANLIAAIDGGGQNPRLGNLISKMKAERAAVWSFFETSNKEELGEDDLEEMHIADQFGLKYWSREIEQDPASGYVDWEKYEQEGKDVLKAAADVHPDYVEYILGSVCLVETKNVLNYEGEEGFLKAFENIGELAMLTLMEDKKVMFAMERYTQYLDKKLIDKILDASD